MFPLGPSTANQRPMLARHVLSPGPHTKPVKKIYDGADVSFFLTSLAYRDIVTFVLQLNHAMVPRKVESDHENAYQTWPIGSDKVVYSEAVLKLRSLLAKLEAFIQDAPPDTGPRRFGNVSFREWHRLVEDQMSDLLKDCLPSALLDQSENLALYLLGSFGSPQRLDYGTGHELSFLAFLGCLWKLSVFPDAEPGVSERGIVLGVFEPYFTLIRTLIKTYTLEPAGSHGVWGLDDNSFLPYIFGSAQLCPAISDDNATPQEGSVPNAPEPSSVTNPTTVSEHCNTNTYFSAIAFITAVKSGPFWEHSPMLYDISGIPHGWGKINKGMLKMYNAEVLAKFPVVQHFFFGELFRWARDVDAVADPPTANNSNQPLRSAVDASAPSSSRPIGLPQFGVGTGTAAPWAIAPSSKPAGIVNGVSRAPWASRTPAPPPTPRGVFDAQNRGAGGESRSRLEAMKARLPDRGPTNSTTSKESDVKTDEKR